MLTVQQDIMTAIRRFITGMTAADFCDAAGNPGGWRNEAQGEQREPWVSEGQSVEPPTGATEARAWALLPG